MRLLLLMMMIATGASVDGCKAGQLCKSDGDNTFSCAACPAGQKKTAGGDASGGTADTCDAVTSCTPCAKGRFSVVAAAATKGAACDACPTGQYQDQTGQATCKPCPAGTTGTAAGACATCAVGRYSSAGKTGTAAECTACSGYLKVEQVKSVTTNTLQGASPHGVSCIKLGPLNDLEWWGLVLIILGCGIVAVVLVRVVLQRTGGIVDVIVPGARQRVSGIFSDHPSTTFNNAPVSPRAMEMTERGTAPLTY